MHLFGFLNKKFNTMHGPVNFKLCTLVSNTILESNKLVKIWNVHIIEYYTSHTKTQSNKIGNFHNFFILWFWIFYFRWGTRVLLFLLSDQIGNLADPASYSKVTCVFFTSMKVGKIGKNGGKPPLSHYNFMACTGTNSHFKRSEWYLVGRVS